MVARRPIGAGAPAHVTQVTTDRVRDAWTREYNAVDRAQTLVAGGYYLRGGLWCCAAAALIGIRRLKAAITILCRRRT